MLRAPSYGLSLIELMVVIAIAAVLFGLGLPSLRGMIDANRIASEVNLLQGDLRLARAEAVRRGAPVALCVSRDGASCAASGSWRDGWIVFSNRAGDGAPNAANGDQVLRIQRPWSGSDLVDTSPARLVMVFNSEGFAAGARSNTAVTVTPALGTRSQRRCVLVNLAGTVTTAGSSGCP